MLKYILLATAMTLSAPALAQEAPKPADTTVVKDDPMNNAPLGSAAKARPDPTASTPTATPPATTAQSPTAEPATDGTAPTSPADQAKANKSALETTPPKDTAQTANAPTQETAQAAPADANAVNSVIDREFASYDKDSNGSLSKAEFGAWMDALKAKSPSGATAAADPNWNEAAFAQADTDKSKALSKVELASFLGTATKSAS